MPIAPVRFSRGGLVYLSRGWVKKIHRPKPFGYHAYLLRFWSEGRPESNWRFSLEDPHTGKRIGFADLERLLAFLSEQMRAANPNGKFFSRGENQ